MESQQTHSRKGESASIAASTQGRQWEQEKGVAADEAAHATNGCWRATETRGTCGGRCIANGKLKVSSI